MSAHTAGPWTVAQFGGQDKWAVGPDVAHRVCDTYGEANARLIASAPDLLSFAEWVLSLKTGGLIEGRARDAIARATGATP